MTDIGIFFVIAFRVILVISESLNTTIWHGLRNLSDDDHPYFLLFYRRPFSDG